jgi:FMN phosphatase YigB (HAD superfamily)
MGGSLSNKVDRPKILLLDLDGTLLGSRKAVAQIIFISSFATKVRREKLGPLSALRFLKELRASMEQPETFDLTNAGRADVIYRKWLKNASIPLPQLIHGVFETMKPGFYTMKGAAEFLKWAKEEKFRLVLATNPLWPRSVVEMRLGWGGLGPEAFEFITSAENMHYCKLQRHYYPELLSHLGARAQDCVMVGDSLVKDAHSAEAGIRFFHFNPREIENNEYRGGGFKKLRIFLGER